MTPDQDQPPTRANGRVRLRRGGPLVVDAAVALWWLATRGDRDGGESEHPSPLPPPDTSRTRENVALCRCGNSSTMPWCDGTHRFIDVPLTDATGTLLDRSGVQVPRPAGATEATGVTVVQDGPLVVQGLPVHLPDGQVVDEPIVAVCRCGGSGRRPWCDEQGCAPAESS